MSMLKNQADALVKVQNMSAGDLEELFGAFAPVKGKVAGALYNSDTDGMKNVLLHSNPAGVLTGLKIAAVLSGAQGAVLIVNCPVNEQELQANANMLGLPLTIEQASTVSMLDHRDDALYCFDELAAMASRLLGETPGCLISVDDGVPQEVGPETEIASMLPGGVKGILADHSFYSAESLRGLMAGEMKSHSGVIHTIGSAQCVVDLLKREIRTLREKSCGKCVYCREGLYQLSQTVQEITEGRAKAQDVELAKEIAEAMTVSCSCSLGDLAGKPLLSVAENFGPELEAHVKRKECAAGVCLALIQIYVDLAKCQGCGTCVRACPKGCIEGKTGFVSMIDGFSCDRCGVCLEVCPNGAVVKTSGRAPKLPSRLTRVKGARRTEEAAQEKQESAQSRRRRSFGRVAGAAAAGSGSAPSGIPSSSAGAAAGSAAPGVSAAAEAPKAAPASAAAAEKPAQGVLAAAQAEAPGTQAQEAARPDLTVKKVGNRRRVFARAKGPEDR